MIELRRENSQLSFSPTVWILTLDLAKVCGWSPQGTRQMLNQGGVAVDTLKDVRNLMSWQIEYVSNDGQTFTTADAQDLARALTKAAVDGERIIADWSGSLSNPPIDVRTSPNGFKWFTTAEGKIHLKMVADFCRGGAFQIF